MKDYELIEAQARMMRLAEKYGVDDWRKLVQHKSTRGWVTTTLAVLSECDMPFEYRYAIGVVEGKPVFDGDTLYTESGTQFVVTPACGVYACSWNPPAPKTVMVETPISIAKYHAGEVKKIGDFLATAEETLAFERNCRKALEGHRE